MNYLVLLAAQSEKAARQNTKVAENGGSAPSVSNSAAGSGAEYTALSALFVLVRLTGSILAFWQAIDEWLNAGITRVDVPPQAV